MGQSNGDQLLKSHFVEADVAYIGAKNSGKAGLGTDQQPVLFILGTNREGNYPNYLKTSLISVDNKDNINRVFQRKTDLNQDCVLHTDGKTTFSDLDNLLKWKPEKINYEENHHALFWLNKIISLVKENIEGIYRGVKKRDLPLFLNEQEWRYNHRFMGEAVLSKVKIILPNHQYVQLNKSSQF